MAQSAISSHYTFGDTDLAAERLSLLADTYEQSSHSLLDSVLPSQPALAIDLGCGLGHTTQLLATTRPSCRVVGYERSTRYLLSARNRYPHLTFVEQDVLALSYPHSNADVVYARFLLTHLPEPHRALKQWATLLKPTGCLVLEEVAHLASPLDELQRYYELVAELQAHYGQELHIGRKLEAFARRAKHPVRLSRQVPIRLPGERMARLHAMNIATWKKDPYMSAKYGQASLEQLEAQLLRLAQSTQPVCPVTCTMAQLVIDQ